MSVNEIVYSERAISIFIQCFLFPLAILSILINNKTYYEKLNQHKNILLMSLVFAGVTPLLFLIFPSIYDFYSSLTIDNELDSIRKRFIRGVGLSENLTFSYSYIVGATAAFFMARSYSISNISLLLASIVAVSINARIGFIPIIMAFLYNILKKPLQSLLLFALTFTVFQLYIINLSFNEETEQFLEWVLSFFRDIFNIITDGPSSLEEGSTLHVLYYNHVIMPKNILFGEGTNLFTSTESNSDIGFVTQLNYGGIVFMFLLMTLLVTFTLRLNKNSIIEKKYVYFFFISIILLNLKGSIFSSIPITRLFSLIYLYLSITHSCKGIQKNV